MSILHPELFDLHDKSKDLVFRRPDSPLSPRPGNAPIGAEKRKYKSKIKNNKD
jgi:hypothetical protein